MSEQEVRLSLKTAEEMRAEVLRLLIAKTMAEQRTADLEAEVGKYKPWEWRGMAAETRVAELEAEVTRLSGWVDRMLKEHATAESGRLTAEAENARLTAALADANKTIDSAVFNLEAVQQNYADHIRHSTARVGALEAVLTDLRKGLDYHFDLCRRRGVHPSCAIEEDSVYDEEIRAALGPAGAPPEAGR